MEFHVHRKFGTDATQRDNSLESMTSLVEGTEKNPSRIHEWWSNDANSNAM